MTQTEQLERHEVWRNRVAAFRASGQSGAAWRAAQGVKPHLLYYWLQRFQSAETERPVAATQWLPVAVNDSPKGRSASHLVVRVGSAAIEVRPGFDVEMLTSVVRVLKALC